MTDTLTKEKRSWNMSRIKAKNTKPEIMVRSRLHRAGYRFRLHVKDLPGKPDIVLPKYNTVIFVNGCFWHQHQECRGGRIPKSRKRYWEPKLLGNVERDKKNIRKLRKLGWRVKVVWECEINKNPQTTIDKVIRFLEKKQ
jgi:DNA mismatch endonuclease (patch repair protein)